VRNRKLMKLAESHTWGLVVAVLAVGLLLQSGGTAAQNGSAPPASTGLAGQFLVAGEEMGDPRFAKSVIYMVRHEATGGAMGLIVNRPISEVPIAKLLGGIGLDETGVNGKVWLHYGGPVEPQRGFTLHTDDYAIEESLKIAAGISLTPDPEVLRAIGQGRGPRRYLVALGFAGWAPGQLEVEMKAGAWIAVPADAALLFDDKADTKWERAKARRMTVL
jgi:putative transcriptional regulator